jgi:transposase
VLYQKALQTTPPDREPSSEVEWLRAELAASRCEAALLRQKLDLVLRRMFGSASEKVSKDQLELLLALAEEPQAPVTKEKPTPAAPLKARTERRQRLPQNLPVVEEVLEPEAVKAEPGQWRRIGEEVSEQLDYEPGRFFCRRLIRPKYVHRSNRDLAPIVAALPERLLERSLPAPGLLAHVLVSKYCDHLPLYRQERIYTTRHGVHLPRQTLARWVELAADWLRPIYQAIRSGVMAGGYVQVDETPVDYLDPGGGKTGTGWLWTASRPGGDVIFRWETSRAASCVGNLLPADFTGTLQCDGYGAYPVFARNHPHPVVLAGCWAHVRRKFHEARDQSPKLSGWFLRQIQHLYRVEAELRESHAGIRLRAAVRASESRMVVQRLHRALVRLRSKVLPKSLLGTAISYALGQWAGMTVYLDDGRVEIDNNLVENAIRPTALGKKNWLFVGEAGAGQRGAILYSVIESCRRRKIDPYAYLRDVLSRLPSMTTGQITAITPANWAGSANRPSRIAA